jgi:zinc protease
MARYDFPNSQNILRKVLPNGIRVLAYETPHVASVAIDGGLKAGALYELPDEPRGTASMTASALLRGTHQRDFDAIHETLESIGAELNSGALLHNAVFSGKALAEDLPTLLELLSQSLRSPSFPEALIEPLRQQRMTGLKYSLQDTRFQSQRVFRELLYPQGHPLYGLPGGDMESLSRLTSEVLQAYHQRVYTPRDMIVVIVGAIAPEKALEQVERYLGDWQAPASASAVQTLPVVVPPSEIRRSDMAIQGKTQVDIVMGTVGPSRHDSDYIACALGNSILGEFGMMGRIGAVIREELGLAYYAYSALEGGESRGAWVVSAGVAPHNVELAIERVRDEIRRICDEGVSADDLRDNQSYFIGRLPLRLETNGGIAASLEMMERYQLGLDYLLNYADMIRRITRDDVQAALAHYLSADALCIATAGTPILQSAEPIG